MSFKYELNSKIDIEYNLILSCLSAVGYLVQTQNHF